jgi:anti-sigma factor RsiW
MDCTEARGLIELELEDALDAARAAALSDHASGCASCASLRAELRAIDAALLSGGLERAPEGFASAVLTALERRKARARFPEPAVITLAVSLGLGGTGYAVARALGAGPASALGGWLRGAADAVRAGAAAAASRVPGLDAGMWDNPVAAGVLFALAAVGLAFFVVVLWRFPKQLSAEWR